MSKLRVWTNRRFKGHFPVGTAAVVVAETPQQAAQLLTDELRSYGLYDLPGRPPRIQPEHFVELDTTTPHAAVLQSGDY